MMVIEHFFFLRSRGIRIHSFKGNLSTQWQPLALPWPSPLTSCTAPVHSSRLRPQRHRSSTAGPRGLRSDACASSPSPSGSVPIATAARPGADGWPRPSDCSASVWTGCARRCHRSAAGGPGSPSAGSE